MSTCDWPKCVGACDACRRVRVVNVLDMDRDEFFSLPEDARYEVNREKCRALGITFVEVK